jgi:hypothetical protein
MGLFSESPHLWLNGTGTISILWGSLCSLIPRQIGFSEAMIFWELQSVGCGCCWRWPQWSHGGSVPCPCESPGGSAREAACTGWRSSHGGDCPGVQILKSKLPSELTSARHYPGAWFAKAWFEVAAKESILIHSNCRWPLSSHGSWCFAEWGRDIKVFWKWC